MTSEQWSSLAFSIGMSSTEETAPRPEAKRFTSKIRKLKRDTKGPVLEGLEALVTSIEQKYPRVHHKCCVPFHRDAVPDEVSMQELEPGWAMRLPTPVPSMTFGYSRANFCHNLLELQQGIISSADGNPGNLAQISQPVDGLFWPFLLVEVSTASVGAAKDACAGAAATCNNALMILTGASRKHERYSLSARMPWDTDEALRSFSLAICGKEACLNVHQSGRELPHSMATIRTYRLDDDRDVQVLLTRIESILIWAENSRLPVVLDELDRLDRRVHGSDLNRALVTDLDLEVWLDKEVNNPKTKDHLRFAFLKRLSSWSRIVRL